MNPTKPNPGRTNQKLYFARLQFELMQLALREQGLIAEARALSCREAAILHLHGAFLAFLQELCQFYRLPLTQTESDAIREALAAKGQVSPEITRIQQWESDSGHWLAQLQRAHGQLFEPSSAPDRALESAEDDTISSSMIPVNVMESDLPLDSADQARLQDWQQQLAEAVREFRREMMEW